MNYIQLGFIQFHNLIIIIVQNCDVLKISKPKYAIMKKIVLLETYNIPTTRTKKSFTINLSFNNSFNDLLVVLT